MKYLLDSNICIYYLKGRDVGLMRRFNQLRPYNLLLCSVVKAELLYGARKSKDITTTLNSFRQFFCRFDSLFFDDDAAEKYGALKSQLQQAGTPIGPNDLLIASIALAHNLILITRNHREFSHVHDLKIEEW